MPPLAPSHHTADDRPDNDPGLSRGNGIVYLLGKPFFSLLMSGIVAEGSTLTLASRGGGGHSDVGFGNFRQMRATLRVFLRMEQMGLENDTQVISVSRRRHDMASRGGVA